MNLISPNGKHTHVCVGVMSVHSPSGCCSDRVRPRSKHGRPAGAPGPARIPERASDCDRNWVCPNSAQALASEVSSFLLGPDDVVKISVLNDPDLETTSTGAAGRQDRVLPGGRPQAAGRTVEQLRDEIVSRLRAKTGRSYRLGIQDVIEIKVYGHGDLDSTQTIGPDGTISILPGGSIRAAGKTVDELADEISKHVSDIVQNPILNVSVKEYRSQPLFISDPWSTSLSRRSTAGGFLSSAR